MSVEYHYTKSNRGGKAVCNVFDARSYNDSFQHIADLLALAFLRLAEDCVVPCTEVRVFQLGGVMHKGMTCIEFSVPLSCLNDGEWKEVSKLEPQK